MKAESLLAQIALGEDSIRQFKADLKGAELLASEMAAFANTNGGTIFADDHDGCLFTATVHRKPVDELELADIAPDVSLKVETSSGRCRLSVGKASGKLLDACREKPSITIPELAELIGITERSVQRNMQNLQKDGLLRRIGGRKEGHWEVME